MDTRTTLISTWAGVGLELVEEFSPDGEVCRERFKITTARPILPWQVVEAKDAEEAFYLEVMASLTGSLPPVRSGQRDLGS